MHLASKVEHQQQQESVEKIPTQIATVLPSMCLPRNQLRKITTPARTVVG